MAKAIPKVKANDQKLQTGWWKMKNLARFGGELDTNTKDGDFGYSH